MKFRLLVIDPQRDFCDGPCAGSLAVPGAHADMVRLAALVNRLAPDIDRIQITLDSHQLYHVANPVCSINRRRSMTMRQESATQADGNPPPPFTVISAAGVEAGQWRARNPESQGHALFYVRELARKGNYPLTVWPPHCLIGTPGHAVHPELMAALLGHPRFAAAGLAVRRPGDRPQPGDAAFY